MIQGFRRQLKDLQTERRACIDTLLPGLTAQARASVENGRKRLAALPSIADSSLQKRRLELDADLRSAEELLRVGEAEADFARLRQAQQAGEDVARAASTLSQTVDLRRSEALEAAKAGARRAVIDAESAYRALGEPPPRHRQVLTPHMETLRTARERLAEASDLETVEGIRRSSITAASVFDELRTELSAERRQPPPPAPDLAPSPLVRADTSPVRADTPPVRSAAPDPVLRSWIQRAENLLADLGPPPGGPPIVGATRVEINGADEGRGPIHRIPRPPKHGFDV